MKLTTAATVILALVLGCASGGGSPEEVSSRMARLYPLGQPPPQDSVEIRFVRSLPPSQVMVRWLDAEVERVGTLDLDLATEVYAYNSRPMSTVPGTGIGHSCDYVLLNEERQVIGAFRILQTC